MESVSLPDHRINISLRKLLNEKSPLYKSFRMKVSLSLVCHYPHTLLKNQCHKWIYLLGSASAPGALASEDRVQEAVVSHHVLNSS